MYVDILTYEFISPEENIVNYPLDWPAITEEVEDNSTPLKENYIRLSYQDYISYMTNEDRKLRYKTAAENFNNSKILRIYDIVDEVFLNLPLDKINFRQHLKKGIYLNKTVTMLKNGRPSYCVYDYEGTNYVRIRFEFLTNEHNLVTNKKTILGYYNKNDGVIEEFEITNETIDLTSMYGLQKAVKERFSARSYIFDEIKSYVNAVLLQVYSAQNKTYEEILTEGGNFWRDYDNEISSWCHIGGMSVLVDKLNQDTTYAFLSFPSGFPNMTIKDWIIDKITY